MLKPSFRLWASVIAAILLVASCKTSSNSSSSRFLKFNLEKGKGYDYDMSWKMKTEFMGQKTKMDMTAAYSVTVEEDNGTVKTLRGVYDRIFMEMEMMGMSLAFDSDNPVETSDTSKKNPGHDE